MSVSGPNVSLMATNHPLIAKERVGLDRERRTTMAEFAEEIHIGDNVWLACNVVVLGGVRIGDGAVIRAGVVDKGYSGPLSGFTAIPLPPDPPSLRTRTAGVT